MEGAQLASVANGRLLALSVPGLSEGRPSVRRGDSVYASAPWVVSAKGARVEWQGHVEAVFRVSESARLLYPPAILPVALIAFVSCSHASTCTP